MTRRTTNDTDAGREALKILRRAVPWLARAYVEKVHETCAAPNDLPNCLAQAEALLESVDRPRQHMHTLRPEDVGKCTIRIPGRCMPLCLSSLLGRVQRGDVGKRIYGSHDRGGREVLYLETDLQRDARQRKA